MMDCVKLRLKGEDLSEWSARVRNFECSFCKREFRSAQALGGHMNVHRRDRARLRLLPPNSIISGNSSEYPPYPNPNPNPNPKYSYFSSSSSLSGSKCALPPFKLSPNSSGSSDHGNRKKLMIFDSGAGSHQQEQHHVPDFLRIPKKGNSSSMRGRANRDYYEAGDRFKGAFTTSFSQKHGHDSEDHLKAVRKDEKQINHLISRVDLEDMEFLLKDPNHVEEEEEEEELDLELRLGHRSLAR